MEASERRLQPLGRSRPWGGWEAGQQAGQQGQQSRLGSLLWLVLVLLSLGERPPLIAQERLPLGVAQVGRQERPLLFTCGATVVGRVARTSSLCPERRPQYVQCVVSASGQAALRLHALRL